MRKKHARHYKAIGNKDGRQFRGNGNRRESYIRQLAEKKGYKVLRAGWPDFLLYRESDGKSVFLEVKAYPKTNDDQHLNKAQKEMHKVLKKLGLNVQIVYVK
jgi:hypothetical protein